MKQFIILLATVLLVSCGSSTGEATAVDTLAVDTTQVVVDSVKVDTAKVVETSTAVATSTVVAK